MRIKQEVHLYSSTSRNTSLLFLSISCEISSLNSIYVITILSLNILVFYPLLNKMLNPKSISIERVSYRAMMTSQVLSYIDNFCLATEVLKFKGHFTKLVASPTRNKSAAARGEAHALFNAHSYSTTAR